MQQEQMIILYDRKILTRGSYKSLEIA